MRAALRCAILDDYQQVALSCADWSALHGRADITVFTEPFGGPDDTVAALAGFDAVVAMRERTPFPAPVLARLPRLRLLVTTGMRNASIDLAAAQRHGVVVCGTASLITPPVELTWALILGLAKHLVAEGSGLRSGGRWQAEVGTDLAGATLGLIGLGKIGTRVAAVGRAFGMDVVAWSQNLTAQQCVENGVRLAPSLSALLGEADFAGLDVFELEPLPAQHPYRTLPNVLATPHIGYVTRGNYALYFRDVVDDITAFVDGLPVRVLEP